MILTLEGNVPSQKNGKEISVNRRTGQRFVRSNDRVLTWKRMAISSLSKQFKGFKVSGYPITIELTFYFNNDRRHDLDNAAAGVMDALKDASVIIDDNVHFISRLILVYGGIDKEKPRVDILLC